jgi:hypothetical protein
MKKLSFLRLISVIHAVKCNKTVLESEAIASFEKLTEFQNVLKNANEEQINDLQTKIVGWKSTKPIATDEEINELFNKSQSKW